MIRVVKYVSCEYVLVAFPFFRLQQGILEFYDAVCHICQTEYSRCKLNMLPLQKDEAMGRLRIVGSIKV